MRWDNVLFAYIFVAYVIFITLRGELPIYMGFLLSDVSVAAPQAAAGPVGGAETSSKDSTTVDLTAGNILGTGVKAVTGVITGGLL